MKKITSLLILVVVALMFALALAVSPVLAAEPNEDTYWGGTGNDAATIRANIENDIALGNKDPREIAANVINVILGFLGIIAVIIILAGGFKWMTAGGNQDKVDEAKKLMAAGVIGLVIVLAAFGIARFIISSLVTATS